MLYLNNKLKRLRDVAIMAGKIKIHGHLKHWQVPARTEMYAFESITRKISDKTIVYLAFPWATLIDCLSTWSAQKSSKLLLELSRLNYLSHDLNCVATVCQHILCLEFIELFEACGVTDLFFSHKLKETISIKGIRIHPFFLFPAQTFDLPHRDNAVVDINDRRFLANFVGSYNSKIYLSDVRKFILEDEGKYDDFLIVKRKSWHFDRHVYQEQMKDIRPEPIQVAEEKVQKREYIDAIRNSIFTLCPTGSGPNSIRIFESIDLLSIPVILSKDLHLPGSPELWKKACVIVEDNQSGYKQAIKIMRGMGKHELEEKISYLKDLRSKVMPDIYGEYILDSLMPLRIHCQQI